jgi:hypothetical protein
MFNFLDQGAFDEFLNKAIFSNPPPASGLFKELLPGIRTSRRGHRMCAVHILECISSIERVYKIDLKLTDDILYDAVIRNDHTSILWKIIKRLRNELVHGYLTVDTEEAVRIFIANDLPIIKKILQAHYPNCKAQRKKRKSPASVKIKK